MAAGLTLGSVDLMGNLGLTLHALGTDSGTSWGNATPITEQLQTFLQYGSIVVNNGWETREATVVVQVRGNTAMMNAAESALFAEVGKPNKLTYTPPGSGAAATVFRVIYSSFENTPDDLREVLSGMRVYTIKLICEPFAYSADLTTVPALPASGSTTTLVDACSSTTGWTAGGGTVSTSGGAVLNTSASVYGTITQTLTRAGSVTTSSTKYLQIDWQVLGGDVTVGIAVTADGTTLSPMGAAVPATAGYTGSVFQVPASMASFSTLVVSVVTAAGVPSVRTLQIDNINRTDIAPALGGGRQMSRVVTVAGSAPTEANIALEHATLALGNGTIVYTRPDPVAGYVPALRGFLYVAGTPGTTTTDATLVSGARTDPDGGISYRVPFQQLPRGTYSVYARVRASVAGPQSWVASVSQWIGSNNLGGAGQTTTQSMLGGSQWQLVCLAAGLSVPAVDVPTTSGSQVQVVVSATPASGTLAVDEVWLFETGSGALTIVDCNVGVPSAGSPSANRLWITSPTVDRPRWGTYIGFAADQSDAHYPGDAAVLSPPTHLFPPGQVQVFTVTPNATFAACSLSYYAGFSNHAA